MTRKRDQDTDDSDSHYLTREEHAEFIRRRAEGKIRLISMVPGSELFHEDPERRRAAFDAAVNAPAGPETRGSSGPSAGPGV